MNLDHLRAFVWLRWRLLANQVTKGHIFNQILLIIFAVGGVLSSIALFVGGFVVGALVFALADIPSWVMLVVWDGLVVAFLFTWSIGVLQELQRSEALSIEKFLHLPVSLAGVFVLNYLSSLFSINLLMFMPMLVGFSLGLVLSKGLTMLLLLPLLAAFLLMVTALTYQFQGWLASLMVNKRRRRTIIVLVTFGFILLFQLPNALNLYFQPWNLDNRNELNLQQAELNVALANKAITKDDFQKKMTAANEAHESSKKERDRMYAEFAEEAAWITSAVLPPGWLAIGASDASEGNVARALLGIFGMGLIGAGSLWRAYRTTLRLYTGQFTAGKKTPAAVIARAPATPTKAGEARPAMLLERQIAWLSEPATVIALATFRSLTRAPEAKMLLLSPVIMVLIFGGIGSQVSAEKVADPLRPLIVFGAMALNMLSLLQIVSNQFGFDRSGFKIYVLSPALRRDVLLAKNLAILPLIAVLTAPLIIVLEFLFPMPIGYLLAVPFEFISMSLLLCLPANLVSILSPMQMAPGSMNPASPKVIPILVRFLLMLALPLAMAPVMLPWGIEAGLAALEVVEGIPICLVLSALECMAVIMLYRWLLDLQGRLVQYRELQILEAVTTKEE
jgi:ABC-2 type transport system permease protein